MESTPIELLGIVGHEMLTMELPRLDRPLRLLCLGAHCDDIEIGCGGTILRWLAGPQQIDVDWVVFSGSEQRRSEALAAAERFLGGAHRKRVAVKTFRDGFFPDQWADIKADFESLKSLQPDLILTHYHADLHQDHRTISDLTWNTFRDHLILEYEILKLDPDLGNPNLFVPLEPHLASAKAAALLECFASQRSKSCFTEDSFLSMMRIRGVQSGCSRHAEGFYTRRSVLA